MAGYGLGFIPILIGVFLGAPLLAGRPGERHRQTRRLAVRQPQSAGSPPSWGSPLSWSSRVTAALSVAFGWWWGPVKTQAEHSGLDRRHRVRQHRTRAGGAHPVHRGRRRRDRHAAAPDPAVHGRHLRLRRRRAGGLVVLPAEPRPRRHGHHQQRGRWDNFPRSCPTAPTGSTSRYLTATGDLIGWGSCNEATEKARNACLEQKQVVGWKVDYIPISQMSSMQWFGASILLALTAAVAVFIFVWGRKRLV